jgi:hypothetical protein
VLLVLGPLGVLVLGVLGLFLLLPSVRGHLLLHLLGGRSGCLCLGCIEHSVRREEAVGELIRARELEGQ